MVFGELFKALRSERVPELPSTVGSFSHVALLLLPELWYPVKGIGRDSGFSCCNMVYHSIDRIYGSYSYRFRSGITLELKGFWRVKGELLTGY